MVFIEFIMVWVSDYLGIELFDDSGIGETVIPVIEHRNDQMFMDNDAHDFAGVNDSLGDCNIVLRGRDITAGVLC